MGGLTWVGEEGPEMLNLRRGVQIINAKDSLAIVQGALNLTKGFTETPGGLLNVSPMLDQLRATLPMMSAMQSDHQAPTTTYHTNEYHLTMQSVARAGTMKMEFEAMELIGAIAS